MNSVYCYLCVYCEVGPVTQDCSCHTSEGGNVVQPWAVPRYGLPLPLAESNWYPILSVPPCAIGDVNFRRHRLPSIAGIFMQCAVNFVRVNFVCFLWERKCCGPVFFSCAVNFFTNELRVYCVLRTCSSCFALLAWKISLLKSSKALSENLLAIFPQFCKAELPLQHRTGWQCDFVLSLLYSDVDYFTAKINLVFYLAQFIVYIGCASLKSVKHCSLDRVSSQPESPNYAGGVVKGKWHSWNTLFVGEKRLGWAAKLRT